MPGISFGVSIHRFHPDAVLVDLMSAGGGATCGNCDFFFVAIARRTGAFTQAFCRAVRDDNHFVAPALIRHNLEHLLLLHAAAICETGVHDFTAKLMKGTRTRDLRNNSGEKMSERLLVRSLEKELKGTTSSSVQGLYDWCNKFTHFGTPLLFGSFEELDDDGHFTMLLAGPTFHLPAVQAANVRDWIEAMKAINFLVRQRLTLWTVKREEMWSHQ